MTLRSPESPYTLFSLSETPSIHKTLLSPLKKTPTESAQSPPIYKHQNSPGSMSYRTPSLPALCTLEKPPVPCMKPAPRGPQSLCWPRLPENSLFFKSNNFPPWGNPQIWRPPILELRGVQISENIYIDISPIPNASKSYNP